MDHHHHDMTPDTQATAGKIINQDHTTKPNSASGTRHDDTFNLSTNGAPSNQFHVYGADGDDRFNLSLATDQARNPSQGYHVFGGAGHNTYNFTNIAGIKGDTMGRLDDFAAYKDTLMIEGRPLDIYNLDSFTAPGVSKVFVTEMRNPANPDLAPQQWLVIEATHGARALYALEGARQDATAEERHFISNGAGIPKNLPVVQYEDPINYLQHEHMVDSHGIPRGGQSTSDDDTFEMSDDRQTQYDGGHGNDTITGHRQNDHIYGNRGDDVIKAGDGDDFVDGGMGADRIEGGAGNDIIDGGKGHDTIHGGAGNDVIYGGVDRDLIYGDDGDDVIYGGSENDVIYGGRGKDFIHGGTGDDFIDGGEGIDIIRAARGNDTVIGGAGDVISLGEGADKLYFKHDGKGPMALQDYAPEDQLIFGDPRDDGQPNFDLFFGHDAAGNLILSGEDLSPLMVIRANETDKFHFGSLKNVASITHNEEIFEGDLYAKTLEEAEIEDDTAVQLDEVVMPKADAPAPEEKDDEEEDKEDKDSGGGSCFVATAAYENPAHPEVVAMRRIRDEVLVKSVVGRAFVRFYWRVGPHLARSAKGRNIFGRMVRQIVSKVTAK